MQPGPPEQSYDLDRTDTLPVLVVETDDTGTLAVPHVAEIRPAEAAQLPRRLRVADDLFSGTDSFTSATLAGPMAAIPVSVPDLAESLREREEMLVEAARRETELAAQLAAAARRLHELDEQLEQADNRSLEFDAKLEEADRRCGELESQLAALTRRCAELEQRQAEPVPVPAPAPLQSAVAPVDPPRALLQEIGALRRTNTLLHESISSLHGRLGVHEAMLAEAEEALRSLEAGAQAPASQVPALQASTLRVSPSQASASPAQPGAEPLHVDWASRYAELELMLEGEREEAASRIAALRAELSAARVASGAGAPVAGESGAMAVRVLIRVENGEEIVHALGRRTTIGRTPDNDIQVDTTYVSRHHAVLLSSAGECIIEDLNSTNGLLVNGQRVVRQILKHGDLLAVGKTLFRYESRS